MASRTVRGPVIATHGSALAVHGSAPAVLSSTTGMGSRSAIHKSLESQPVQSS